MKRALLWGSLLAGLGLATLTSAKAETVIVRDGPGWHHWHHRWHPGFGAYGFVPGACRMVVRTHWNRWGERVTVRRRVCD